MSKFNQLSGAIRFALFAGAASVLATGAAAAQDKAATLDRIEVTGSRIKRVDSETTQPVQVITRAEIEKTGLNNVYDILNNITSSDGSGLSTVTTQTNGSDGSEQISLRGLGADRTLVLVDGKRWVTDIDGTVDLSTIPVAIIERIDVLKDGASAIYGSDAIAGVVNIVTRKNYEGAQASVYYGQTTKDDGELTAYDMTIGAAGERSSVVMSASFSEREPVMAGDRRISSEPIFGCGDYLASDPGNAMGLGAFCGSTFGQYGVFVVPGLGAVTLNPSANLSDGITVSDFRPFDNRARYNFAPVNYLQQPSKRSNLFAYGRFDITDNISAYARMSYSKRTSTQQLAEVPLTISNAGTNGPQWAMPVTADMLYNPFGVQLNSTVGFRMSPAGGRRYHSDYDIFAFQAGLEGTFSLGDRYFSWDLMAQRNDGQYDQMGDNFVNLFNLRNALGPSGYDQATNTLYCGTSFATRIRNCVPFNIFGGPTLGLGAPIPGATNGRRITAADVRAMLDYVTYTLVQTAGNTTVNYSGNLSGDLFELPGGMMGFALGFEYRKDDAFNQPDTLVAGGGSSTNFTEPTRGGTEVKEYFLEIVAPLLKDVAGAKELELSAAVRKSDYSAAGFVGSNFIEADPGAPTNAKVGLRWKPIDELMVRASWGETFRAPSAFDLYAGGGESFPATTDFCRTTNWASLNAQTQANCVAQGVPPGGAPQPNAQIRALVGGNPFLSPETGENRSLGVVWSPNFIDGLDITADYWRVELENVMTRFGSSFILRNCVDTTQPTFDPGYCSFIERLPGSGQVVLVRTAPFNASFSDVSGIDLGISYRWDAGEWGNFAFKWDTTYLIKSEFRLNEFSNTSDSVGLYTGQGGNWEYRSNFNVTWNKGDWSASYTARYLDRLEDTGGCFIGVCSTGDFFAGATENFLGSTTYHDIQVSWKAPWDASVTVGARNVFGKEPPMTASSFAHSFDAAYDLPGGAFWYARYRQTF